MKNYLKESEIKQWLYIRKSRKQLLFLLVLVTIGLIIYMIMQPKADPVPNIDGVPIRNSTQLIGNSNDQ